MTKPKGLEDRTAHAPLKRCFYIDTERASTACTSTKKNTQLARDCHLLITEVLSFFARNGVENFKLNHTDEARRLEITEARVKKAIERLKAAGIIVQTRRQAPGVCARYRVNEKFAHQASSRELQRELAERIGETKREVLRSHGKPRLGYGDTK